MTLTTTHKGSDNCLRVASGTYRSSNSCMRNGTTTQDQQLRRLSSCFNSRTREGCDLLMRH